MNAQKRSNFHKICIFLMKNFLTKFCWPTLSKATENQALKLSHGNKKYYIMGMLWPHWLEQPASEFGSVCSVSQTQYLATKYTY